ncbi:hypothetical protein SAMN06265360_10645 [Haloechinothrix alba]|uniref:Uncharacterized protein n=1 Tax=Haloechinothrix alba TaxID=664784 RepID=A0A238WDN1_9PSEU|nr:hypothetical protein [Haloechinothrix alba]SNR44383.1 hypothetical protein SAMN06265360_10645 [Haloechinothrix alba]
MGDCVTCNDHIPDPDLLDHLRVMHPDEYAEPERWPDGMPVVEQEPTDVFEALEGEADD